MTEAQRLIERRAHEDAPWICVGEKAMPREVRQYNLWHGYEKARLVVDRETEDA